MRVSKGLVGRVTGGGYKVRVKGGIKRVGWLAG